MKGGDINMVKTFALGILTLAISFFVGTSYIHAQTATATPTPTDSMQAEDDTPSEPPKTGFGN